jgi:hypothetical protein
MTTPQTPQQSPSVVYVQAPPPPRAAILLAVGPSPHDIGGPALLVRDASGGARASRFAMLRQD